MKIQNNIISHNLFSKIFVLSVDHIIFNLFHLFNIRILFQVSINHYFKVKIYNTLDNNYIHY